MTLKEIRRDLDYIQKHMATRDDFNRAGIWYVFVEIIDKFYQAFVVNGWDE